MFVARTQAGSLQRLGSSRHTSFNEALAACMAGGSQRGGDAGSHAGSSPASSLAPAEELPPPFIPLATSSLGAHPAACWLLPCILQQWE